MVAFKTINVYKHMHVNKRTLVFKFQPMSCAFTFKLKLTEF